MRCLKNAANESYESIRMHFELLERACNICFRSALKRKRDNKRMFTQA
jgi:hypothetical protein